MVVYHPTCSQYWHNGETDANSFVRNVASIREAVGGVKTLIKMGNITLASFNLEN